MAEANGKQPHSTGRLGFRVHRGGAELRPATQDELGDPNTDLPTIEDGISFVTAQLHGDTLRVTVGSTVTSNGQPVNREYEITDERLIGDLQYILEEIRDATSEHTMEQAREDARANHRFNQIRPEFLELFRERRVMEAQEQQDHEQLMLKRQEEGQDDPADDAN